MKKTTSLLLLAALLCALAACGGGPDQSGPPSDSGSQSEAPVRDPDGSGDTSAPDTGSVSEPEPEPALEYDPDYTLDIDYPKAAKGELELPVRGATGYASVQLPIWEEIPEPEPEEPEDPEGPGDSSQTGDSSTPPPGDSSQSGDSSAPPPGDSSQTGDSSTPPPGDSSQAGDSSVPPPGDSSQTGDSSAPPPGDSSQAGETVSDSGLVPSSPFIPDFSQPGETGETGETVYPPGEEPVPEQPEPEPDPFEGALAVLDPGTAFRILEESEDGCWWRLEWGDAAGWIENKYCLINLPDVIPSMVYNATNSYDSRFVSLGKEIPNVTGRAFYPAKCYNRRLERDEFMMPVLYPMSKRICQAQQAALAQGNTLVLYEGYRPHQVQSTVYKALSALSREDSQVKQAVSAAPWSLSWFIAGGYSNHQRGFAIDVTLAKVHRAGLQDVGGHQVLRVLEYEEYAMPTPIHELSRASATYTKPVASHSPTAWRSAEMTETMAACRPALALQGYCTGAGLTPLASEWWHFNDLETRTSVLDNLSTGGYKISECLSAAP